MRSPRSSSRFPSWCSPLSKQAVLLDAYKSNLNSWRSAVSSRYYFTLKSLALRMAILALVVALVIALAEIWRKATFRYVHDVRRRSQLLLLRRIAIWIVIAIAIAFALASQIGSIATFVGLITAGVAVSLQTLIMAIAGYFFLIGTECASATGCKSAVLQATSSMLASSAST